MCVSHEAHLVCCRLSEYFAVKHCSCVSTVEAELMTARDLILHFTSHDSLTAICEPVNTPAVSSSCLVTI